MLLKILNDLKDLRPSKIQNLGEHLIQLVLRHNRDMSVNTYITLLYFGDLFSRNHDVNTPGIISSSVNEILPKEI